jgi:hypothetical protein
VSHSPHAAHGINTSIPMKSGFFVRLDCRQDYIDELVDLVNNADTTIESTFLNFLKMLTGDGMTVQAFNSDGLWILFHHPEMDTSMVEGLIETFGAPGANEERVDV